MKKRHCLVIALCVIASVFLCACGQSNEAPETVAREENHPRGDEVVTAEDGSEVVPNKSIDYAAVLMVTINPEALFYMDDDENVLKIEALNKDAEDVLSDMSFTTGNFTDCYGDYLEICHKQGYLKEDKKQEIKLTLVDKQELAPGDLYDILADEAERLVDEFCKVHSLDLYVARDERASAGAPASNRPGENPPGDNHPDNGICDLCGGVGIFACETCNGTGIEICIEHRTEEVRNDYVCPVCGGKGWVDDGMHGGLTAVCGHCTKDGGNADFKALAYDIVEMDVEVEQPCHQCGGGGKTICNRCNGSGQR